VRALVVERALGVADADDDDRARREGRKNAVDRR
jgi:hypothetical protein